VSTEFLETTLLSFKAYLRGHTIDFGATTKKHLKNNPEATPTKLSQLALVSDEDIKKTVLLTSQAKAAEHMCKAALLELEIRLREILNVDRQTPRPIKPSQMATAFISLLESLNISDAARDIAMSHFNKLCISGLPHCFEKLNMILVS
jgi:hypothetical protein